DADVWKTRGPYWLHYNHYRFIVYGGNRLSTSGLCHSCVAADHYPFFTRYFNRGNCALTDCLHSPTGSLVYARRGSWLLFELSIFWELYLASIWWDDIGVVLVL